MEQNLIPLKSSITALQDRLCRRIIRLNKGLGDKSVDIAEDLANSGIGPSAAVMLMNVIYSPTDGTGKGQFQRANWVVKALKRRRELDIEKARTDRLALRRILCELEEVTKIHDELKGEGIHVNYEEAFILNELGLDAESFLGLIFHHTEFSDVTRAARWVKKACIAVYEGKAMSVECALDEMLYGRYQS